MVKLENEQIKFQIKRNMKLNVLLREQLEKRKKIIERQKKLRYYPIKRNDFSNFNYFNSSTHYSPSNKKHLIIDKNDKNT